MSTNVVSLTDMNAKFEALMGELATLKAAQTTATPSKLSVPTAAAIEAPRVAKVAAQPSSVQVAKPGTPMKLSGQAAEHTGSTSTSGKPCGYKSPNGLCQKCNGPFNPVLHYSMEAVIRLDGSEAAITHENWKSSRFMGISVDPKYYGNVVIVGFGKDCINLRPKNAVALFKALSTGKAATHIESVLKHNGLGNLLAAE